MAEIKKIKKMHVRKGLAWTDKLQLAHREAIRALGRGLGPGVDPGAP